MVRQRTVAGSLLLKLACALALVGVYLHLRVLGFGRTIVRAQLIARSPRYQASAGLVEKAREVASVVERLAALFPGRARCLEQSIAVFVVLRWHHMPADLQIGARLLPFSAHAWVEIGGEPVNADPEALRLLVPFPKLPSL